MITLLGQTKVVVFKDPHTGRECRWWSERGLIHYEDVKANGEVDYGQVIEPKTALKRIKAINDMLGMSSDPGIEIDPEERRRLQTFVEQMVALLRQAREQGNPYDKFKNLGRAKVTDLPAGKQRTSVKIPTHFFMD